MKHRVGEQIDERTLRRYARQYTKARTAEYLGVHWETVDRLARVYQLDFLPAVEGKRGYGWRGTGRRVGLRRVRA